MFADQITSMRLSIVDVYQPEPAAPPSTEAQLVAITEVVLEVR